jgi:hypothetical protein
VNFLRRCASFLRHWFLPVEEISPLQFYLRILVIAAQLVLAYCLAQQNNPFFYQAF